MCLYAFVCMLQLCEILLPLNDIAKTNLSRVLFNLLEDKQNFKLIKCALRNKETNPNVFQVHMI